VTDKLAVILLDALDAENIRQLGMGRINQLYREKGDVLGISTLPHTALSNPMIWAGYENEDKFWVKEPGQDWTDPARGFSRDSGEATERAERTWRREDFETSFIWDDLEASGIDACAVHVPIVLPPYSYNTVEGYEMGDFWFPDTAERMAEHVNRMPELILEHAEAGREFIAASIQMPDKWLHGQAEGACDEEFVDSEAEKLDRNISELVEQLEQRGFDWILMGDHGSPWPGAMMMHGVKQLLPRHRKESVIISNLDTPVYTGDLYSFFLDLFDAEEVPFEQLELRAAEVDDEEVKSRLENLGYR
jgi:hypothetical protein